MLEILGLSTIMVSVYEAVLAHPGLGVTVLAETTGLTETQVHAALDELADLALLRPSAQVAGGLRAVSPDIGLSALLAAAEAVAAERQRQLDVTRRAIAAMAAEHEVHTGRGVDGATRLEGVDAVRARLEQLAAMAQSECLSLNPGGAHRPDAREASAPLNQQALQRGVAIRAICRDSSRNDRETLAYVHELTKLGGQIRTIPIVPMPLVIVDQKIALLPLDPNNSLAGALEVTSPGILAASYALFTHLWNIGVPFETIATADERGLTATERTLLELASTGHTDEAAARKLGVSTRTVKRMMAELMDRLDAHGRFQAGANASRRGWV